MSFLDTSITITERVFPDSGFHTGQVERRFSMVLSPEERQKIYEEEKARIETREQLDREKGEGRWDTTTGMKPNVVGLLCYLGWWITGIIFLVLEQKNRWIRFHAVQSIIVFGSVTVAAFILKPIPFIGLGLSSAVYIIGIILCIVLMVKAFNGEKYKVAWAGDMAENIIDSSGCPARYTELAPPPDPQPGPAVRAEKAQEGAEAGTGGAERATERVYKPPVKKHVSGSREARIAGSAFVIAWSIALLVFFNFFNRYIAYYYLGTSGGTTRWMAVPVLTGDFNLWLPILNIALAVAIVGHVILIMLDRYILREIVHIVTDVFSLVTVITLLSLFPFDFNVISNAAVVTSLYFAVPVVLVIIIFGTVIGLLVRAIRLLINVARGVAHYG
ncbi:DUF4870 domain-containing protein [Chloroflexota bacterium]